jgi:hypothetical protein
VAACICMNGDLECPTMEVISYLSTILTFSPPLRPVGPLLIGGLTTVWVLNAVLY